MTGTWTREVSQLGNSGLEEFLRTQLEALYPQALCKFNIEVRGFPDKRVGIFVDDNHFHLRTEEESTEQDAIMKAVRDLIEDLRPER